MTPRRTRHFRIAVLFAAAVLPSQAQDSRKVSEPAIPPACTVLQAKLGRAGSSIAFDDESKLDTARIQAALDGCAPGHAVVLRRSAVRTDAFLSGPLDLRKGVALVVERGAYLYASRNPRDYDRTPGACGTIAPKGGGCRALINGDNVAGAAVMGEGVIDGRGGESLLGQPLTWWNLADRARKGGNQNNPRLIMLRHCDNFTLYRITLLNGPMLHVGFSNGNGFTAWGVRIWSPQRARNTDGIDPGSSSTNVTIAYCYIHTGDDQVAIKAGTGAPTTHLSILHNHFYTGHGMSIGSETNGGASAILVSDLSIDGADIGLHIKSDQTRGGLVQGVTYEDVCIRGTRDPVLMETSYAAYPATADPPKDRLPEYRDITLRNVRVEGEGRVRLEGLDENHRLGMRFDNVVFDDPSKIGLSVRHAAVTVGPGPFNLVLQGLDLQGLVLQGLDLQDLDVHGLVRVEGMPARVSPNACEAKFVPFPLE